MRIFNSALSFCLALAVGLFLAWGAGLRWQATPSMAKGIYIRLSGQPVEVGEMVTFCLDGPFAELAGARGYLEPSRLCPSGLRPLAKFVAGLPGDVVDTAALDILTVDKFGNPLPSALTDGPIPDGFALVLSDVPGSFDSRYFGLVPLSSLERIRPVFIYSEVLP